MASTKQKMSTQTLVMGAIMTAFVIVFQLLATYTTFFGPFSTALALIPIVIGAAMCGTGVGAWLGFVFGVIVMITGGANLFFAVDVPGTVITVLAKGTLCGAAAGLVYKLLQKFNKTVAVFASAIVCPVVNTGVFLLGSYLFFMDNVDQLLAKLEELGSPMTEKGFAVFLALASANFLFELGTNIVVSPIIVRLLNIRKKQ